MQQRALGAILVRQGIVSEEALEGLLAQQAEKGTDLVELLVSANVATSSQVTRSIASECGLGFVEKVDPESVPIHVGTRLPIGYARSHLLLVVAEHEDRVDVVLGDPLDTEGLDDVRACFGKHVHAVAAPPEVVEHAINRVYERKDTGSELESTEDEREEGIVDILDSDDEAPIIRWVNGLFSQAVKERASDI
ncbi:MAG: hypothetical protein RJA70_5042, partial [Pseudomonadota bacterium]